MEENSDFYGILKKMKNPFPFPYEKFKFKSTLNPRNKNTVIETNLSCVEKRLLLIFLVKDLIT